MVIFTWINACNTISLYKNIQLTACSVNIMEVSGKLSRITHTIIYIYILYRYTFGIVPVNGLDIMLALLSANNLSLS